MRQPEDYKRFGVIYVDDEKQSLKYFEKAYSKEFRVITASSASEAWQILKREGDEVAIIISDQRMPEQTGVDLLAEVRKTWPSIIRIITTAYTDLQDAIEGVNRGEIYRYITKPWDIRALRGELLNAMHTFLLHHERNELLEEKFGVLQRFIKADRIRDLIILASSITHSFRHSLHAAKDFLTLLMALEQRQPIQPLSEAQSQLNLWELSQIETQRTLNITKYINKELEGVNTALNESISLKDLLSTSPLQLHDLSQGTVIQGNKVQLQKLLTILVEQLTRLEATNLAVTLKSSDSAGIAGVQLTLTAAGATWPSVAQESLLVSPPNRDITLLIKQVQLWLAFLICYHHGGRLTIENNSLSNQISIHCFLPTNPAQATLPALADNWMDELFAAVGA